MSQVIPTLDEFTGLSLAKLPSYDIVDLNYHAASGLPGTETSDLSDWHQKLDDFAARTRFEIRRHLYRFDSQSGSEPTPFGYGNSLGRFFCWCMLQVLQEDCGVAYHPDRKFKPDFCQPKDVFVHGILDNDGQGGTCASMPVIYVSIGRRLGLPVYLVETRGHAFFRWDDAKGTTIRWAEPNLVLWIPPDRFNVEGSGEGIAYYPDSHYIQCPEPWTEIDIRHGRYLRSKTSKEELAGFLIERGECCWDLGRRTDALQAYHFARQLVPDDERYNQLHALRTQQYDELAVLQMREIEQDGRQAKARRSQNPHGHSPGCRCYDCRMSAATVPARPFPSHSPSCECWNCRTAREAASAPAGLPGHLPTCLCSGCAHQRLLATMQPPQGQRHGLVGHHVPPSPGKMQPHLPMTPHAEPKRLP